MKSSGQIKEIRSRLNLSQSELAEKLGVSFATVNRWEKGHCEPSQKITSTFPSWKVLLSLPPMKSSLFITAPSLDYMALLLPSAGTGVTLVKAFTWARSGCSRSH